MIQHRIGRALFCWAAVGLLFPAAYSLAESVLIAPKFETGQVRYIESKEEITQRMRGGMMGEQGVEFRARELRGVLEKVESTSPGEGTRLRLTFDRVGQSLAGGMMSMAFDSDFDDLQDRSNPAGILFAPMLGMSIVLELDKSNQVVSASGAEAILEKMEESALGNPMLQQQRMSMTDEAMKANYGDAHFALYPNRMVKDGDPWKASVRLPSPIGPMLQEYDCRFERMSIEDGRKVAVVAYEGTIRRENADEPVEAAGPMGPIDLESGSFKGTAFFDPQVGRFVTVNGTAKLVLGTPAQPTSTTDAPEGDDSTGQSTPPAGLKIEIDIESTISMMTPEQRNREREANEKKGEELRRQAEAEEEAEFADEDD